jgi:TolB-like protein/DNA-binding winged helix-turn-helix (wHTH) protein/Flp pilus assembly protein TadD
MTIAPTGRIRFGQFEVDRDACSLSSGGARIKLQQQPFDLLIALLEQPGRLVSRDELRERMWPSDTFVDFDHSLNIAVNKLRAALNDSAEQPRFIETVPRRGYRFVGTLEVEPTQRSEIPAPPIDVAGSRSRLIRAIWAAVAAVGVAAALSAVWMARRTAPAAPAYRSIAVLSLDNLSPDPNEAYLADGITDELTTDLAKISSLRVISRGSVLQFRDKRPPSPQIGGLLDVQAIVEGSVTRSGDRVRVTAQLIDAAADRHLWAESYERSVNDLLGLQREVAAAIADRIQAKLTVSERATLDSNVHVNTDAYLAYIKGRAFWNQRTRPALERGVAAFEEAIRAEPAYARAYAGLADCYTALGYGSYLPPNVAFTKAEEAASRAIALDAGLADPHASLGYAKFYYDWDFAGANMEFQRALALDPKSVTALDWHSVYLTAMGRFDEGRTEIRRARDLDPLSAATNTDVGFVDYYSGRYADASKQLRATIEMSPAFPLAHLWLGRTYQEQHEYRNALDEYMAAARVLGSWPVTMAAIGHLNAVSGRRDDARRVLKDLEELSHREYVTPYGVALVHAGLGDSAEAFDWLDKAVADRSNWLMWLKLDPRFASLHGQPRFNALVRRVGLGTP